MPTSYFIIHIIISPVHFGWERLATEELPAHQNSFQPWHMVSDVACWNLLFFCLFPHLPLLPLPLCDIITFKFWEIIILEILSNHRLEVSWICNSTKQKTRQHSLYAIGHPKMNDLEPVCQEPTTGDRRTYITFNNTNQAWTRLLIGRCS